MRRLFIHERKDWPKFHCNAKTIAAPLASVRHRQSRLIRQMTNLGFDLQREAVLQTLTSDVLKTTEIEGEKLIAEQVRSSLARRLGMDIGALKPADRNVEGSVELMLDATRRYSEPLTRERLFAWHAALFPTGYSGMRKITTGAWRDDREGPMKVVSGPIGKERIHYQAPSATLLDAEMTTFLHWFEGENSTDLDSTDVDSTDAVLRAAIAHLWFVTIHPFDDGNGRIARAIADMALARSEHSPQRFYSMSAQIKHEHQSYYDILESTQKGPLDITPWMEWFLACLGRSIDGAHELLDVVIEKARFWDRLQGLALSERQRRVINRLLDGFTGKLTSSKYAAIAKCSQDTAHRDIRALVDQGVLRQNPEGGRSTSYSLTKEP
ncbi:MAG: Fic family protein [Bryobacter sp.]|nr:Fic family protein [Bryobacter sp.]